MAKNKTKKVGRPTEYDKKYAQELHDYFKVEPYKKKFREEFDEKKGEIIKIETGEVEANDIPTLAGFAIKIGVHRDTLHEWANKHDEFSDAYKMAKEYQEHFLTTNGLKGLISTAFGIFTAKNILGWRDRQEHEHKGANGETITPNQIIVNIPSNGRESKD